MYEIKMKTTDFKGVEREETYRFNLTKAELVDMQFSTGGTFTNHVEEIIGAKDQVTLIKLFKELLLKAYGEVSDDGRYFLKQDKDGRPLSRMFEQTQAYSDLYMKLATDDNAAAEFVNNIIPKDLADALAKDQPQLSTNQAA